MKAQYWWKLTLILIIATILLGLTGCQLIDRMENEADKFSRIPDRVEQALFNLLGGIKNVGTALADSIKGMIGNMNGP